MVNDFENMLGNLNYIILEKILQLVTDKLLKGKEAALFCLCPSQEKVFLPIIFDQIRKLFQPKEGAENQRIRIRRIIRISTAK